jgi:hypothetical protein
MQAKKRQRRTPIETSYPRFDTFCKVIDAATAEPSGEPTEESEAGDLAFLKALNSAGLGGLFGREVNEYVAIYSAACAEIGATMAEIGKIPDRYGVSTVGEGVMRMSQDDERGHAAMYNLSAFHNEVREAERRLGRQPNKTVCLGPVFGGPPLPAAFNPTVMAAALRAGMIDQTQSDKPQLRVIERRLPYSTRAQQKRK